jgi:hypothetical protein
MKGSSQSLRVLKPQKEVTRIGEASPLSTYRFTPLQPAVTYENQFKAFGASDRLPLAALKIVTNYRILSIPMFGVMFTFLWFETLSVSRGHPVAQLDEALCYKPGRSRVRFAMRSVDFSIHLILPAALRLWGRLSL